MLPPREAVLDAHILRKSRKDVTSNEILAVSLPRPRLDERVRLLRQAGVEVRMLDVEPLALLNAAIHLTALESGELLVLLTVGQQNSTLCLFSEHGPVVARYLSVGATTFSERLRSIFPGQERSKASTISAADAPKAEAACQDIIDQMAEDIRLSLTFYRTEYDRESLPRYAIGGSVDLPYIGRWVAGRLGLGAPLEMLDPLTAAEVKIATHQRRCRRVRPGLPPGVRARAERGMSARFRVDFLHPGEDLRQIGWLGPGLGEWLVGRNAGTHLVVCALVCVAVLVLSGVTGIVLPYRQLRSDLNAVPALRRDLAARGSELELVKSNLDALSEEARRQLRWGDLLATLGQEVPPTLKLQNIEATRLAAPTAPGQQPGAPVRFENALRINAVTPARPGSAPLLEVAQFMAGLMRDPEVSKRFQLKSWDIKPADRFLEHQHRAGGAVQMTPRTLAVVWVLVALVFGIALDLRVVPGAFDRHRAGPGGIRASASDHRDQEQGAGTGRRVPQARRPRSGHAVDIGGR